MLTPRRSMMLALSHQECQTRRSNRPSRQRRATRWHRYRTWETVASRSHIDVLGRGSQDRGPSLRPALSTHRRLHTAAPATASRSGSSRVRMPSRIRATSPYAYRMRCASCSSSLRRDQLRGAQKRWIGAATGPSTRRARALALGELMRRPVVLPVSRQTERVSSRSASSSAGRDATFFAFAPAGGGPSRSGRRLEELKVDLNFHDVA
jgi:hypothetical protein